MFRRMRKNTRAKGMHAEGIAADHLAGLGYRVVERNFTCRVGEIDIVARQGGDLVFVEVRSRHSSEALDPVYSIDRRKQMKIIRAAQVYLSRLHGPPPSARFDVVLVTLDNPPIIEVITDAFNVTE
jgi:putative endonuclease